MFQTDWLDITVYLVYLDTLEEFWRYYVLSLSLSRGKSLCYKYRSVNHSSWTVISLREWVKSIFLVSWLTVSYRIAPFRFLDVNTRIKFPISFRDFPSTFPLKKKRDQPLFYAWHSSVLRSSSFQIYHAWFVCLESSINPKLPWCFHFWKSAFCDENDDRITVIRPAVARAN